MRTPYKSLYEANIFYSIILFNRDVPTAKKLLTKLDFKASKLDGHSIVYFEKEDDYETSKKILKTHNIPFTTYNDTKLESTNKTHDMHDKKNFLMFRGSDGLIRGKTSFERKILMDMFGRNAFHEPAIDRVLIELADNGITDVTIDKIDFRR